MMFSVVTKYHKGRHSLFLYNLEIFCAFTQDILRSHSNPTTQSQEGVAYKVFSKTLIVILWILLVLTMGTALLSFLNIIPNVITMKLGTVKLNIQMIGDSSPSVVAITVGIITALFGIVRFVKDIRSSLKKSHHRKN